jgi:hypothetical protein
MFVISCSYHNIIKLFIEEGKCFTNKKAVLCENISFSAIIFILNIAFIPHVWGDENHQKTGFKLIPFLSLIIQAEQK